MTPGRGRSGFRWSYYAVPLALLCLVVYRHAFRTWFHMDDFAWLSLGIDLRDVSLWQKLFRPQAQGTVRVISERLFFLVLSSVFGMNPIPFKVVVFLTQFANLTLLAVIARRLTDSTLAGFIAAAAFLFNSALTSPMAWLSAYNQILEMFVVLAAFYLLLKYVETDQAGYNVAQWTVFLLGFGVHESIVVYPGLAALYTFCFARRFFKKTLVLFIPAVAFTIVHFTLIPKAPDPLYQMHFDSRLLPTFGTYLWWALGPSRLGEVVDLRLLTVGYSVTALIGMALVYFAARERSRLVFFLLGWFGIFLAPVLPLSNHITDYYVMLALPGLCILGGWACSVAVAHSRGAGLVAGVLLLLYCGGHYAEYRKMVQWRYVNSRRMREILPQVAEKYHKHTPSVVLLGGVDWDLFAAGFNDRPFRLYDVSNVYLVPGSESQLATPELPRGVERYKIPLEKAVEAVNAGRALVLSIGNTEVIDSTLAYAAIGRTQAVGRTVDVGKAESAGQLGEGWYSIENGFRWMGPSGKVRLVPPLAGDKLGVSGYCPAGVVAAGPVHLTLAANGVKLGTATIKTGDSAFQAEFAIPGSLAGASPFEVTATVDRATIMPGDKRELGLIFGTFALK